MGFGNRVHLYKGQVGGGRFAITACTEPKHMKNVVLVTENLKEVNCKLCLKREAVLTGLKNAKA